MKDKITIEARYLEHLLNCLSDQKRIHEIPERDRAQFQTVIDTAWRQGIAILQHHKERTLQPPEVEVKQQPFSDLEYSEPPDDDVFSLF